MGAWEENKERWSAGWGMEKKRRRRAQEADRKAGETSSVLCIRVTALTLQIQNLFSLSTVTFTWPDQVQKRASGVRGRHVLKGQGSFYSSHVILQWVSFLSFSHHPWFIFKPISDTSVLRKAFWLGFLVPNHFVLAHSFIWTVRSKPRSSPFLNFS